MKKILTESDGYFNYLGLLPGAYYARIDTHQLRILGMTCDPRLVPFNIEYDEDGDIADGLKFTLEKIPEPEVPVVPESEIAISRNVVPTITAGEALENSLVLLPKKTAANTPFGPQNQEETAKEAVANMTRVEAIENLLELQQKVADLENRLDKENETGTELDGTPKSSEIESAENPDIDQKVTALKTQVDPENETGTDVDTTSKNNGIELAEKSNVIVPEVTELQTQAEQEADTKIETDSVLTLTQSETLKELLKLESNGSENSRTEAGEPKDAKITKDIREHTFDLKDDVYFTIQIVSTKNSVSVNWLTDFIDLLGEVEYYTDKADGISRYYIGKYSTYKQALEAKAELHRMKFTDSFIIVVDKGEVILLQNYNWEKE
ncbi:MAG: hypothetical protein HRT71_12260 [Flavobacteriales bacterium]|nr:hypothetical protein [Flavobacteriales bacterium]